MWSTERLRKKVEQLINEKSKEGFKTITVSFGMNLWHTPTAYITIANK